MSGSLILACLWALAATVVAFLPFRAQFLPGAVLLLAVPGVIGWVAVQHGFWFAALAGAAVVSMFRKPLGATLRRLAAREGKS